MNQIEQIQHDLEAIRKISDYTTQILEGKSPFLLLDRQLAETYFPTELRQALIDEVLKDLEENQLFNESSNTSNNSL